MKLLIAIVQDKDAHLLGDEFAQANIRATRLSTTGGFLRAGNTTFIIGIEEERVEEALNIIKENCQSREQIRMAQLTIINGTNKRFLHLFHLRNGRMSLQVIRIL